MKILVTGSDGEIGKEIARRLSSNKKYSLLLLSNKKKIRNKVDKKKFNFFYQNLLNPIKLKFKSDVIIHCAGKHPNSRHGSSMKNIYYTNMKITKNLTKYANENKVNIIFFLSSIAAYGKINHPVVYESQKSLNLNLYEKSKFLSEKFFSRKMNKFKTISLRVPGVFIPTLKNNYPLIMRILKKIIDNKSVEIYNPNEKFNNIVDVSEIVKFINFTLRRKKLTSGIYNFSASSPIKFNNIINLIKKIFKSQSKIINKKATRRSFVISNKKILNNLNFRTSSTKKIIFRCCNEIF